jgi:ATP phosphoribosyltransferase regulatory subunit HisZ
MAVDGRGPGAHGRDAAALPGLGAGLSSGSGQSAGGAAVERAAAPADHDLLVAARRAGRCSSILGLFRDLGYCTSAIAEIYDPALGHNSRGGGRYDDLVWRGRDAGRGFGLYLERVHVARMEEERG